MNINPIKEKTLFKIIPTVYSEAISYWEQLKSLIKSLNKVISVINEHSEWFNNDLPDFMLIINTLKGQVDVLTNLVTNQTDNISHLLNEVNNNIPAELTNLNNLINFASSELGLLRNDLNTLNNKLSDIPDYSINNQTYSGDTIRNVVINIISIIDSAYQTLNFTLNRTNAIGFIWYGTSGSDIVAPFKISYGGPADISSNFTLSFTFPSGYKAFSSSGDPLTISYSAISSTYYMSPGEVLYVCAEYQKSNNIMSIRANKTGLFSPQGDIQQIIGVFSGRGLYSVFGININTPNNISIITPTNTYYIFERDFIPSYPPIIYMQGYSANEPVEISSDSDLIYYSILNGVQLFYNNRIVELPMITGTLDRNSSDFYDKGYIVGYDLDDYNNFVAVQRTLNSNKSNSPLIPIFTIKNSFLFNMMQSGIIRHNFWNGPTIGTNYNLLDPLRGFQD